MRIIRTLIAGSLAVFALSAIVASAAQAQAPEFGRCVKTAKVEKKYTGKYLNAGCTEEATKEQQEEGKENEYEWEPGPGAKPGFKSTSGEGKLETPGIGAVECESDKDSGTITGTKTAANIVVRFKGCKGLGEECKTLGAKAGEIVTNELEAEIGYINKAATPPEVGTALFPDGKTGLLAEFECSGITIQTGGSVIAKTTPVDVMTKEFTLTFEAPGGTQVPENFEGQPKDTLFTTFVGIGGPFPSTETTTDVNKGEEKLEIRA